MEKAFGLPPHYRFTWGHAIGYPLESADAGGQRPRLKFEKLFHKGTFGTPLASDPATVDMLKEKGLIQEQAPLPGRFEEIVGIAERHGRDPGMLYFPAREIRRLLDDGDWDLGPRLREHAEHVIATEDLPDYPDEMRETFQRLMAEHGIDATQVPPGGGLSPVAYEDVIYEVGGGRATITIDRPERLNAFRGQTMLELCDAFERAADDESVGVIVFTGTGDRAFCVGGDVREPTRTMREKRAGHIIGPRLASAMRNNGKPIVCRVRGYCIGGGNELNMISDLTITDTTGRFGQAGPKIGSAPLWWGCQLMPAVVGGEEGARGPAS